MNLKKHLAKNKAARGGFTLIELIVVLMILVGLAGMVIPAVTDMVVRTHTSTASGNIAEVANAVARYEAQYLSYPDQFDSLKVTLASATSDFLALSSEIDTGSNTELVALTSDHVAALQGAGITTLRTHLNTGDPTFEPPTVSDTLTATTDSLIFLTDTGATQLGLTPAADDTYVLLGVGNAITAIGRTMTEAPVHFPENGAENPAAAYNRFLAVFDVSGERAKLVKVISPHFGALDDHMAEYFEIVDDNQ